MLLGSGTHLSPWEGVCRKQEGHVTMPRGLCYCQTLCSKAVTHEAAPEPCEAWHGAGTAGSSLADMWTGQPASWLTWGLSSSPCTRRRGGSGDTGSQAVRAAVPWVVTQGGEGLSLVAPASWHSVSSLLPGWAAQIKPLVPLACMCTSGSSTDSY